MREGKSLPLTVAEEGDARRRAKEGRAERRVKRLAAQGPVDARALTSAEWSAYLALNGLNMSAWGIRGGSR